MKKIPAHYKLVQEHPQSYEIHDGRDGHNFHIAKNGLDLDMHGKLSKIERFSKGGEAKKIESNDDLAYAAHVIGLDSNSRDKGFEAEQASLPKMVTQQPVIERPVLENPQSVVPQKKNQSSVQVPLPVEPPQPASYIDSAEKAIKAGAQAEGLAGKKTGAAIKEALNKIESIDTPEQIHEKYRSKLESLEQDIIDKKIDPKRWYSKLGTGDKILAGIALILGGAGAGKNGENPAAKAIDQSIERDITVQADDRNKSWSLYKMNREALGDEISAKLATKNMYISAVQLQAQQIAAESAGPIALAKIQPLLMKLNAEKDANGRRISLIQAAKGPGLIETDPTSYLRDIPDDTARKEAAKEITEMKQLKSLKSSMIEEAKQLESKFLSGALTWSDRASAADAFAGRLVKLMEGSVSEGQIKAFAHSFFAAPLDLKDTIDNKAKRLDALFESGKTGTTFQSYIDVPLDKFQATQFKNSEHTEEKNLEINYARKNANNPDPKVQRRVQLIKQEHGI